MMAAEDDVSILLKRSSQSPEATLAVLAEVSSARPVCKCNKSLSCLNIGIFVKLYALTLSLIHI